MHLKKADSQMHKSPSKKGNNRNKVSPEKKKGFRKPVGQENPRIFWCKECNVPLLDPGCGSCDGEILEVKLSGTGDIRFCSPYEREVLGGLLLSEYGCDPIGLHMVLLNKIPGEDKTDEVIVDGLKVGVLFYDMSLMGHRFEPSATGAQLLHSMTDSRTVVLKKTRSHLNGKKVQAEMLDHFSNNIKKGDHVIVVSGNLVGSGIALCNSEDMGQAEGPVIRVRKILGNSLMLNPKISMMDDAIKANLPHLRQLGKNAMNTIKGIANQKECRKLPVHVSFSGGKDSLVVLDLTLSALKNRDVNAFFLNTGIEFPETVDFVHDHCEKRGIELIEEKAENAFWDNLESFGPPAKDFRWCCKVCKLAPAGRIIDRCTEGGGVCLTIDGKRKHESFSRANIAASEKNPFVPDQLNIFPIRDWRAIEVWLYIHWRGLEYNPLYDTGFERVGCYLCPAELSAEYERLRDIHPSLYGRWNEYLLKWSRSRGLSDDYVKHGLWRWKELPPKMVNLAKELGIGTEQVRVDEDFAITLTSGFSPCREGGFTVEAVVSGVLLSEAAAVLNIIGTTVLSEDLGMLLVRTGTDSIKFFSSGSLKVTARTEDDAREYLKRTAEQLMRINKCTECGICLKVCPVNAIALGSEKGKLFISDECIRCGRCTDACVVLKYSDRLLSDILKLDGRSARRTSFE
ncbi:phosphoadenosine phosphosulfate reductase family protein [Methanococcoides sp. AM1]|uniref:phosphoadenosine phosphosulfate reductase domain-containing protein n=1 Tax=Methanococcoides sp. AM1 TaxID=1201011 RepID=UPI001082F1DE|nr:phosphoadenosine phosphosulfate reductase family protein [Methanococcoides sp. AM1]